MYMIRVFGTTIVLPSRPNDLQDGISLCNNCVRKLTPRKCGSVRFNEAIRNIEMITSPDKQWRIDNARRLQGLRLQFRRYTRWSESWDHDHCAACWATFAEVAGPDIQHEGYATREDYIKGACYDWICQSCFNDLKDDMGWSAVNGPASMLAEARRKIGELAVAMLTGSVSFIEGARAINHLRFKAELDLDSDIIVFVGIDSETDALPLGEVRKLWDPNALANLQPEIDKAERWARGVGTPHCENLARRFS